MKVFVSAGEASGDALGAALLAELSTLRPGVDAFGMGGPLMKARGFRALESSDALGVVGFVEVIRHLPRLLRLADDLAARAIAERPDVAIFIDVPDFNLRVARRLREQEVPCVFYVGPSIWAWRPWRAKRYRACARRMLVLFPFELPVWRAHGIDAVCVGHPLIDEIPAPAPEELREEKTVALLPGSRRSEIEANLERMLGAASELRSRGLAERFLLPRAASVDPGWLEAPIARSKVRDALEIVGPAASDRRSAIARSSVALVASGTATLETALLGRPQVIVYRVHWLTYRIAMLLKRVPFIGLVNLIAEKEIAPELLQGRFSVKRVAQEAALLLGDSARRSSAIEALGALRARLGTGRAAERAARAVLEVVDSAGAEV